MADADPVPAPEGAPGAPPEAPPANPAPEVPADPPGPAWDDLVAELGLEHHELAHQLLQDFGAPDPTSRPALFSALTSPSTDRSSATLLLWQPISGDPTCTLVALPDRAIALHGLREMFEIDPQGGHCAALGGGASARWPDSPSSWASASSPA
jgi:hypothetical protein